MTACNRGVSRASDPELPQKQNHTVTPFQYHCPQVTSSIGAGGSSGRHMTRSVRVAADATEGIKAHNGRQSTTPK